jgi:phage tail protein X
VPDREEDRDCHQCHNGQFPTVVGHRISPHQRRRTARRRSSERALLNLVFDGAGVFGHRRRSSAAAEKPFILARAEIAVLIAVSAVKRQFQFAKLAICFVAADRTLHHAETLIDAIDGLAERGSQFRGNLDATLRDLAASSLRSSRKRSSGTRAPSSWGADKAGCRSGPNGNSAKFGRITTGFETVCVVRRVERRHTNSQLFSAVDPATR